MAATKRKSDSYRKAMLAKVHIARAQLCIDEEDYRDIIEDFFPGKRSAGKLNNVQLSKLLSHFESIGFRPKDLKGMAHGIKGKSQVTALKEKAKRMLDEAVDMGFVRHPHKLVFKICGVDDVRFCKDVGKLKRLLAVLQRVE
jgi:phage gp16-like protein